MVQQHNKVCWAVDFLSWALQQADCRENVRLDQNRSISSIGLVNEDRQMDVAEPPGLSGPRF